MSQVIIPLIVNAIAFILPHFGVTIGNDAITTTIQTLILVGSGIWVALHHASVVAQARAAGIKGI